MLHIMITKEKKDKVYRAYLNKDEYKILVDIKHEKDFSNLRQAVAFLIDNQMPKDMEKEIAKKDEQISNLAKTNAKVMKDRIRESDNHYNEERAIMEYCKENGIIGMPEDRFDVMTPECLKAARDSNFELYPRTEDRYSAIVMTKKVESEMEDDDRTEAE